MVQSRRVKGAGSARTEGARRASGVGADGAAVGAGALAPGQRWSASRKRDVVLRLLRGESLEMVSREVGVELYRLEAWQARALAGLELGLKAQADEPSDLRDDGAALRSRAGVSHVGEVALGALRAARSFAAPSAGCAAGAPRADTRAVRCAAAGGHSQRWTTGTPSAWAGMCARWGTVSRPSSRSRKDSGDTTARSRRKWPAGWRYGWITPASICRTTSSIRFGTGASTPASASLKSRKPTASSSAGIARSRSKPSTAGSFETSPRCARPSPSSSNATTSAGASKLAYRTPLEAREQYELRHAA